MSDIKIAPGVDAKTAETIRATENLRERLIAVLSEARPDAREALAEAVLRRMRASTEQQGVRETGRELVAEITGWVSVDEAGRKR